MDTLGLANGDKLVDIFMYICVSIDIAYNRQIDLSFKRKGTPMDQ